MRLATYAGFLGTACALIVGAGGLPAEAKAPPSHVLPCTSAAVTKAVVTSLILILVLDYFVTKALL